MWSAPCPRGLAITVAPQHTVLSTNQAGEILGISRPALVRLLQSGEMPFEKGRSASAYRLA